MSARVIITADENGNPSQVQLVNNLAQGAAAVTPSDTVDLAGGVSKGLYVGASGDVKVTLEDGSTVTFTGLAAGSIHPLAVKRIWATGTTATTIVVVY